MRARALAAALLCAAGCGGEAGPNGGAGLAAAVVSDPVVLAGRQLVYVSLPFGSLPQATSASLTNHRTGGTVSLAIEDGGWKPAELEAEGGDSITIRVDAPSLEVGRVVPQATQPVIVRVEPPSGKRDVPLNTRIYIAFSEPLDSTTVTGATVRLIRDGTPVPGQVALAPGGLALTIDPDEDLAPNAEYVISASDQVRDLDGDELDGEPSSFTTGISTAAEVPDVRVEPSSAHFGIEWVGGPGRERDFLVWNIGIGPSTAHAVSITGPAASDFTVSADDCSSRVLAPWDQCTVRVTFRPTQAGSRIALLWVGTVSAFLNGTGEAARLDLTPSHLDFGAVMAGGDGDETSVVVTNTGAESSTPLNVLVLDSCSLERQVIEACQTPFAILQDQCTGASLAPSATCVVRIGFRPGITAAYAAQLLVHARATSPAPLLGVGVGLTTATTNRQPMRLGSGGTAIATVYNSGPAPTGPITGQLAGNGFRIMSNTCDGVMLEPAARCQVGVRYLQATPVLSAAGRLTLEATPGGKATVYLVGVAN